MSIRLEIRGGPELQRALRSVRGVFPAALGAALYRFGVAIASNALPRTPVEFGLLRASHYVSPPKDEDRPTVEIGFGTRYAVAQHEQAHLRHPRGGQAFYLRNAVDALSPRALQLLARDIVRLAMPAIGSVGSGKKFGVTASGMPTRPKYGPDHPGMSDKGKARAKRARAAVRRRTKR